MTTDGFVAGSDESPVHGYHVRIRRGLSGRETLERLEAAISPVTFRRCLWQTTTVQGRTFVVVMPKTPWSSADAMAVRRELQREAATILDGPITAISEAPESEPPARDIGVTPPIAAPDDWYWPVRDRPPASDYKGSEPIRVAHLDTGVGDHPCLHGRYERDESRDYVDHPRRPKGHGVWCWGGSWIPWYMPDHGTSTASLIVGGASQDPRLSGRIEGLTPPGIVELIPIRVVGVRPLIEPWDQERVANAIDWAAGRGRCSVISLSIGTPQWDKRVEDAIWRASRAGVIVCAAAGQGWPLPIWPASTAIAGWSVCCGGSTVAQLPFRDSGWGFWPDGYVTIAAPAEQMPKATWQGQVCRDRDPILKRSGGTSYAAPFVASVAALWRARHWQALKAFPPDEIVAAFRTVLSAPDNGVPWSDPSYRDDRRYGPGIIDPRKVIEAAPRRVLASRGGRVARRAELAAKASAVFDIQTAS